jgi:hypothetical protein
MFFLKVSLPKRMITRSFMQTIPDIFVVSLNQKKCDTAILILKFVCYLMYQDKIHLVRDFLMF